MAVSPADAVVLLSLDQVGRVVPAMGRPRAPSELARVHVEQEVEEEEARLRVMVWSTSPDCLSTAKSVLLRGQKPRRP